MNNIVTCLKSGKIRIIKINQSERDYTYVEQCLKDISTIQKFHYKNKKNANYDGCYFRCIIEKMPFYLFLDVNRNKIVVCNFKSREVSYICESDYEDVKKILRKSKSATYYIKKNEKLRNFYNKILFILLIMSVFLLWAYSTNRFDDGRFGTIALNIAMVMALQDCINVYLHRFERKHYDKIMIFMKILACIVFFLAIIIFFIPGAYDTLNRYNNMLNVILTIGTILLKFDKPRNDV